MQILVTTSDKTMYALRAFSYLWCKYAQDMSDMPIDVAGYSSLPFELPKNFRYHSIGKFEDYPVQHWSDGFLKALDTSDDPIVMCLFDDYWFQREIDTRAVRLAERFMYANQDVIRFDLSSDRLYASGVQDCGYMSNYDLICSNSTIPYHFSLQAGLWRRNMLKRIIVSNESPWECEMRGTTRLQDHPDWKVVSTRQVPMKYLIAYQGGRLALNGGYQSPRLQVNESDIEILRQMGYLENL